MSVSIAVHAAAVLALALCLGAANGHRPADAPLSPTHLVWIEPAPPALEKAASPPSEPPSRPQPRVEP